MDLFYATFPLRICCVTCAMSIVSREIANNIDKGSDTYSLAAENALDTSAYTCLGEFFFIGGTHPGNPDATCRDPGVCKTPSDIMKDTINETVRSIRDGTLSILNALDDIATNAAGAAGSESSEKREAARTYSRYFSSSNNPRFMTGSNKKMWESEHFRQFDVGCVSFKHSATHSRLTPRSFCKESNCLIITCADASSARTAIMQIGKIPPRKACSMKLMGSESDKYIKITNIVYEIKEMQENEPSYLPKSLQIFDKLLVFIWDCVCNDYRKIRKLCPVFNVYVVAAGKNFYIYNSLPAGTLGLEPKTVHVDLQAHNALYELSGYFTRHGIR